MNSKAKKRQHYVWQYYLRAWIKHENKVAVLHNKRKLFYTPTNAILFQDYFYSIEGLTKNDLALIKHILVDRCAIPIEKNMLINWFEIPLAQLNVNSYIESLKGNLPKENFGLL